MRTTMKMAFSLLLLAACDEGRSAQRVGDMCTPESIPNSEAGRGFSSSETYIERIPECGSDVCVVHKLDNHSDGALPADPNVLCQGSNPKPGCVEARDLEASVYCTCRCDGPGSRADYCTCPSDFACREVLSQGPDQVRGSYCVRRPEL
jgi:hypothetical protein